MTETGADRLFVTLEGGEGSGKSTLAHRLAERLRSAGRAVLVTEEPTGTPLGRHIWQYFQDPAAASVPPLAELLLFEAARAQHVEKVIRPALAMGDVVVCDRFTDSSIAYQAHGRGLSVELVDRLNTIATSGIRPDLTLLLDVPVETGLERARQADHEPGARVPDAIGKESIEFHLRVHGGFAEIARLDPARVVVIDAARAPADVLEAAWRIMAARLQIGI